MALLAGGVYPLFPSPNPALPVRRPLRKGDILVASRLCSTRILFDDFLPAAGQGRGLIRRGAHLIQAPERLL